MTAIPAVTLGGNGCRLSVLLVTFNQERYVEEALRSLLGQSVDGTIQVVVADDGSTDRTLDIIEEYEGRDARFHFTFLDHRSNRGITKNYQRGFAACEGEYVAILEGDDYWISPHKLRRQAEFLDAHWECDMCAVNYFVYREERAEFTPRTTVGRGYRYLSARDQIAENLASNFSTCMYRRRALEALPTALFETTSYRFDRQHLRGAAQPDRLPRGADVRVPAPRRRRVDQGTPPGAAPDTARSHPGIRRADRADVRTGVAALAGGLRETLAAADAAAGPPERQSPCLRTARGLFAV